MRVLIVGAGNFLLSDEGFGVHFIAHLNHHYRFPAAVALCDAGTLGILIAHELEQAETVYLIDTILTEGPPGACRRYARADLLERRLPLKLSPHQAGLQEALWVSELRGRCPKAIHFLGIIPASLAPGTVLSPALAARLPALAGELTAELRAGGLTVEQVASQTFD